MNKEFQESAANHEQMQKNIAELQSLTEEKVETEFQRRLDERAEGKGPYAFTPDNILESLRHEASFRLSKLEGQQTLHISLRSANPDNREDPSVVTRINHDIKNSDGHIQYYYEIIQVPDGDLFLEKGVRDLTKMDHELTQFNKARSQGVSSHEIALASIESSLQDLQNEKKARFDEKQLGLQGTDHSDLTYLHELLAQAEPFSA